jgi:hypothetical protein
LTGFRGDAALYRLDPPMEDETVLVIASAVDLDFGGFHPANYRTSETMVFPATEDGEIADWGEIGFAAHKSHADALKDMGYDIA